MSEYIGSEDNQCDLPKNECEVPATELSAIESRHIAARLEEVLKIFDDCTALEIQGVDKSAIRVLIEDAAKKITAASHRCKDDCSVQRLSVAKVTSHNEEPNSEISPFRPSVKMSSQDPPETSLNSCTMAVTKGCGYDYDSKDAAQRLVAAKQTSHKGQTNAKSPYWPSIRTSAQDPPAFSGISPTSCKVDPEAEKADFWPLGQRSSLDPFGKTGAEDPPLCHTYETAKIARSDVYSSSTPGAYNWRVKGDVNQTGGSKVEPATSSNAAHPDRTLLKFSDGFQTDNTPLSRNVPEVAFRASRAMDPGPSALNRHEDGDSLNSEGDAADPTNGNVEVLPTTLVGVVDRDEADQSNGQVEGLPATLVPTEERDDNLLQLTQALITLQEEIMLRNREIPTASIVEPGTGGVNSRCQCIII